MPRISTPTSTLLTRRHTLKGASSLVLGGLIPFGLAIPGCKALLGEETIDAFVIVGQGGHANFYGFTEYELDEAAGPDDAAELRRVLLKAPPGFDDLRFLTSLLGEVVMPTGERTPIVSGQAEDFPANDTMASLEVLFEDNLQPFFTDGKKIRIEWTGSVDTVNYTFPAEGVRINALVTFEVL
jgi:hypothetical protein